MINEKEDQNNEIIINVEEPNEFEETPEINEFEEDENDFLAEQENKETPYVVDSNQSANTKTSEISEESQAVSNELMLNPENEKLLFEKLGKFIFL